jgi:tellurite resistance protein
LMSWGLFLKTPDRPFSFQTHTAPAKGTVMSKHRSKWRSQQWRAELAAAYQESHEDELFDLLVSAAALTARADGRVEEVERAQLLDFLDRRDLLWMRDREDVLAQFDQCASTPDEQLSTLARLRRYRDSRAAELILEVCDEVAVADCRLDPREDRVLRLVRASLDGVAAPRLAPQIH